MLLFQISLLLMLLETARDETDSQTWTETQSSETLIPVSNLVQHSFFHPSCVIIQKHYFNDYFMIISIYYHQGSLDIQLYLTSATD